MEENWIVILEAAEEQGGTAVDLATLKRLMVEMADIDPALLHSPYRYALQLSVRAPTPPAAVEIAFARWKEALRQLGVPTWRLVRAQVMTARELQEELDSWEGRAGPTRVSPDVRARSPDPESEALLRRAMFDSLTGLPSDALFHDQVRRVLRAASPAPGVHALLLVNVDGLTAINAELGPDAGDKLLVTVARRVSDAVRDADVVARLRDHEFAVFVTLHSLEAITGLATRILDAARIRLVDHGRATDVTAGIGVATGAAGTDPDGLLEQASIALRVAKSAGRGRYQLFGAGVAPK